MSLVNLVDNERTTKNTMHSYLPLYDNLLLRLKDTAQNVLEIGISQGGSIKLWDDYFTNAQIHGIDIININDIWDKIIKDKITLYTYVDAYNDEWFNSTFLNTNIKFDVMIDDGPHTLESVILFIKLYTQLLTDDGILIIENIQYWKWIDILKNEVPENLKQYIKVYDLRSNKNRYDDIVFTIDKCN
jgi:hypothetical protein